MSVPVLTPLRGALTAGLLLGLVPAALALGTPPVTATAGPGSPPAVSSAAGAEPRDLAVGATVSAPSPAPGPAAAARGGHRLPTGDRGTVLRHFDPPARRWLAGHRGVDLASAVGAPVVASADGVVAFRGVVAGRPALSLDHPDGTRTSLEPVASGLTVGEHVRSGQAIGEVVVDPRTDAAQEVHPPGTLHWGARVRAGASWEYIDPLDLLGDPVIRLKPLGG